MGEEKKRIVSIDVMRGINMFSLICLGTLIHRIAAAWPCGLMEILEPQVTHYKGFGLYYYDMIFPTFLFLAGCSWPFSLASQLAKGATKGQIVLKIVKRFLLLAVVGAILFGLPSFDILHVRLNSILGRIGFGWAVVALVTLYMPKRWWLFAVGLFVAYWLSFFICGWIVLPPGGDPWAWGNGTNLIQIVDKWIGKPDPDQYGNEGFYHDFGCICTAFVGYWAGTVLKRLDFSPKKKALWLLGGGAVLGALGAAAWTGGLCPLSKAQWNPTYVLVAGGIDLAFLGILFWIIDVLEIRFWTTFFVVIGANALFIYCLGYFISFDWAAQRFLCGVEKHFLPENSWKVAECLGVFTIKWLLLWYMYRKRILVRL